MKTKLADVLKKYKLPLLVLAVGIALMLIPLRSTQTLKGEEEQTSGTFSLAETQAQMENILSHIAGVGRVEVMLTLQGGTTLQLATDDDYSERETEKKRDSQVVKLNRGSGTQEVIITSEIYPTYQGAVVVCDGADNAGVCLAVTEAVETLTGLSADKITVVKWQS